MGHASGAHLCSLSVITRGINQVVKKKIRLNDETTLMMRPFPISDKELLPVKGIVL